MSTEKRFTSSNLGATKRRFTGKPTLGASSKTSPVGLVDEALTMATSRNMAGNKLKIIAEVDVGFGNYLYIRGDGCGLNWDKGVKMAPIADNRWAWECACGPDKLGFEYKFLINDEVWSTGENFMAIAYKSEVKPTF